VLAGEALGVLRGGAPHPHLVEAPDASERLQMGLRLDPAAEQGQHAGVGCGQAARDRGRDRGGAPLGDEAAVHHREGLAGVRPAQHDDRQVGGQPPARVAGIEAHQLEAHGVLRHRGHDAEVALALLDGQHGPHRLHHAAGGERGQRGLHGRDQGVPVQQRAHARLVEVADHVAGYLTRRAWGAVE